MTKSIIFDTETTGLPLQRNSSIYKTNEWPHTIQLSYIVMDDETHEILVEVNDYILINDDVVITEKSFEVHKISREFLKENGIPMHEALNKFISHMQDCIHAVGHNVSFDKRMVLVEGIRNKIQVNMKNTFCTMKNGTDICAIKRISQAGNEYFKYPNLMELHHFLFDHDVKNLHDASVDIIVCMRCYYKMLHNVDIVEKNKQVESSIQKLMIL